MRIKYKGEIRQMAKGGSYIVVSISKYLLKET